jgi:hypothetical protein
MNQSGVAQDSTSREKTRPKNGGPSSIRLRSALALIFIGLFMFAVGAKPSWFGWDRSPVVGFVQIAMFLIGLGVMCMGGVLGLTGLWNGSPRTILADIGLRLVGTGFVVAAFSGMADVFGMGSQPLPGVPYFGPWQATGVLIGQIVIALGFLMMMPYRRA